MRISATSSPRYCNAKCNAPRRSASLHEFRGIIARHRALLLPHHRKPPGLHEYHKITSHAVVSMLLCQRGPSCLVTNYLLPCGQASHSFGHVFMPNMSAVRWQRRRNDTSFVRTTAARSMSIALDMFLQTFFQQSGLVQQSRPSIYLCQSAHSLNDFEFLGWSHSALVDTVGTLTSQLSELNAIMIFATAHPKDEISMSISPLRPRMPGLCDDNT